MTDQLITFTEFPDKSAQTKTEHTATWPQLIERLRRAGPYASKADAPYIKLARFGDKRSANNCLRTNDNVELIYGIEIDYDAGKLAIHEAQKTLDMFGVQAVLITTASHTTDEPRYRILAPLAEPVSPAHRDMLVARINGLLGGVIADESFTLSQSYHYGAVQGVDYMVLTTDGQSIDTLTELDSGAIYKRNKSPAPKDECDAIPREFLPPASDLRLDDIRSAVTHLASMGHGNDYQDWVSTGMALKAESNIGRAPDLAEIWVKYSSLCEKFESDESAMQKWNTLTATAAGVTGIFNKASAMGWINPAIGRKSDLHAQLKSVAPNPGRFHRLGSAEINALPPLSWCIRGVLPKTGLAALYGPSGSGKSFLALDLAAAIAGGQPWFGCRVEPKDVVYVALEGESGFRLRVIAWEKQHAKTLPERLTMILEPFTLTEPQDIVDMVAVVPKCAVLILDTLNRAAPVADENSSKDMGLILQAAKALQAAIDGLVLVVHHTGKNAAAGLRGHSSLFAALDAAIEVSRDGDNRKWSVAKSKDGSDGGAYHFNLQIHNLYCDDYGDAISSCTVNEIGKPLSVQKSLTSGQRLGFATFNAVYPAGDGVRINAWRAKFYESSTAENQEAKKKAFNRARSGLVELGYLTCKDDVYALPAGF